MRVENEKALGVVAAKLAPLLKKGDAVMLKGDLGAGKTAFARALINVLSKEAEEVPSPTFTLVQTYELADFDLWHFDLYRLEEKAVDILELGWDDARREGVVLVEWPERLGGLLPSDRLEIEIIFVKDSENSRDVIFTPSGGWVSRLKEVF
jgi:tRNA threonylcarbamoyladenosine biosynthesis protein TsaE